MSLDNLNDLVYVNISNTSTSNTSTQKCPINSPDTPCIICQEKCNLSFTNAYFQASCNAFVGGLVYSNLTTNSTSYLTFNENNFTVNAVYLLAPSINTYLKNQQTAELVIESTSDYGYLIIYIPIVIGASTTIIIPEVLSETNSLTNINLYNYLPSQKPYYFYSASYKNSNANYIIFPSKSCNVTISLSDYEKLVNVEYDISSAAIAAEAEVEALAGITQTTSNPVQNPLKDYFKLFNSPIYYNEIGANTSSDNEYYMDCRVADYEEIDENIQDKIGTTQLPETSQSSNILSFILVAIICLLLYLMVIYIPQFIN